MAGAARGHGRVFRAGAELCRSGEPSAQRRARRFSHAPRRTARRGRGAPLPAARLSFGVPMTPHALPQTLEFPYAAPPGPGEVVEVRPGIFWARLALPFRLDHVNLYLVEDGAGLALIDTGIDNPPSRAAWEALIDGPLKGRALTRLIATHFHPDHLGLNIRLDPSALKSEPYRGFYRSDGLTAESTEILLGNGLQYLRMVAPPPKTFQRLMADDPLTIGGRSFVVLTGGGHSPEHVMLYAAEDNLFIAGDQILAKISPNVSVEAMEPDGDPLGIYIRSLEKLKARVPGDVLVLQGHTLPFVGLVKRANELI